MTISYMSIRYFDNICHSSPPFIPLPSLRNASSQTEVPFFPSGESWRWARAARMGIAGKLLSRAGASHQRLHRWSQRPHLLQQATVANSASATYRIFHDFGWNKLMEFVSNPFITAKSKCGYHLFCNFISITNYHFNVLIILRDIKWILFGGICKIWFNILFVNFIFLSFFLYEIIIALYVFKWNFYRLWLLILLYLKTSFFSSSNSALLCIYTRAQARSASCI